MPSKGHKVLDIAVGDYNAKIIIFKTLCSMSNGGVALLKRLHFRSLTFVRNKHDCMGLNFSDVIFFRGARPIDGELLGIHEILLHLEGKVLYKDCPVRL